MIDVEYVPDSADATVKNITISGFEAKRTMVNAELNRTTGMLKETGYWRGIGDAANETWWAFVDGRFVLRRFRVDASYDGDVNPQFDISWPN